MDKIIRNAQLKLLKILSGNPRTFALSGGTALELFYLKHRFSRDLGFFSPRYNTKEIETLILKFNEFSGKHIKFISEATG